MHKVRILCNKGAHPGEVLPELSDAHEAVQILSDVLDFLSQKETGINFEQKKEDNNQPMLNTDYYSPKRKYRGEWSECYTRESLAVIPEYTGLLKRAEAGDISAMLDLAIGFVHKTPVWSIDQLVCMPKHRSRGREYYQENAYDTRYYYWIIRACDQAVIEVMQGNSYPKKYIATAFMDALKFTVSIMGTDLKFHVSGIDQNQNLIYSNQYKMVEDLYGCDLQVCSPYADCWAYELLNMVYESNTTDIISELHYKERTIDGIKYLAYCIYCVHHYYKIFFPNQDETESVKLDSFISLVPEDIGKNVTLDMLKQRVPSIMSDVGYLQSINKCIDTTEKEVNRRNSHPKLTLMEDTIKEYGGAIYQRAGASQNTYLLCCLGFCVPIYIQFLIGGFVISIRPHVILATVVICIMTLIDWIVNKINVLLGDLPIPQGIQWSILTIFPKHYKIIFPALSYLLIITVAVSIGGFLKVFVFFVIAFCISYNQNMRNFINKFLIIKI